jgi:hypothetical protein
VEHHAGARAKLEIEERSRPGSSSTEFLIDAERIGFIHRLFLEFFLDALSK